MKKKTKKKIKRKSSKLKKKKTLKLSKKNRRKKIKVKQRFYTTKSLLECGNFILPVVPHHLNLEIWLYINYNL